MIKLKLVNGPHCPVDHVLSSKNVTPYLRLFALKIGKNRLLKNIERKPPA